MESLFTISLTTIENCCINRNLISIIILCIFPRKTLNLCHVNICHVLSNALKIQILLLWKVVNTDHVDKHDLAHFGVRVVPEGFVIRFDLIIWKQLSLLFYNFIVLGVFCPFKLFVTPVILEEKGSAITYVYSFSKERNSIGVVILS